MLSHPIVFYDQNCPFCCWCISILSQYLNKTAVRFAPLDGITAKKILKTKPHNTLIFFQPPKTIAVRFKAIFLALSFRYHFFSKLAPFAFVLDPFYRLIANVRSLIPIKKRKLDGGSFLP